MTFINPLLAAAGLACIAIPIIIHFLMRRRRKPMMWAAMRFLLEAYRQHRRRLKLEQFLLLAARCLLIALLALALGRPILGAAGLLGGRGAVTLYLLVDNGLAASAQTEAGQSALDRHKAAALSLLDQLDAAAGDRAALLALGGPAQALVAPPSSNTSAMRELVGNLAPTDSPTDLVGGLSAVRGAIEGAAEADGGRALVVILSDFLTGSADLDRKLGELANPARGREVRVLASRPAERGATNVSITGLEPLRPVVIAPRRGEAAAQQAPVRITLRRTGPGSGEAAATTVRLAIQSDAAGREPVAGGQTVVRWAPGQTEATAAASIDLSAARAETSAGSVVLTAIIDNDAVAGDNAWRRPVELRQTLRVGVVAPRRTTAGSGLLQFEAADWFRLALQPTDAGAAEAEIEVIEIEPGSVDAGRLSGLDAAIIARPDILPEGAWRRLRGFADSGGLIVVAPPAQATVHLWADPMGRDLGLPWTIGREARAFPQPLAISGESPPPAAEQPRTLLDLLSAELPELVGPIRVQRALPVEAAGRTAALLRLADGSPLVLAAVPGSKEPTPEAPTAEPAQRGLVVLFTTAMAFDWTDLQAKPLMVPLMQEIIRQGVGRARGAWSDVAGVSPEVPPRSVELRAVSAEGAAPIVKIAAGRSADPIRRAGLWRALDDRGAARGIVAINADPAAGRTDPQAPAAVSAWLAAGLAGSEVQWLEAQSVTAGAPAGSLKAALDRGQDGGRLVLPLLIAALLLAVLELAMARWFSHAVVRQAPQGAAA